MKIYSGFIKDKDKLLQSASGGVVTALSEKIIENNGVVFGVRYTQDFHGAEYCYIENLNELNQLKGSKYITSVKGSIFKELEKKLNNGRLVLFIGLGCDIGAARSYCDSRKIKTDNLYTIDILCHGPAVNGVHENYVIELEKKYQSKLEFFTIRYKKDGWTPFYIKAIFKNGKEHIEKFNDSDYGKAFYNIAKPGCTNCKFKGENHKGDLCCGDFWGMTSDMPDWNPDGVSIMIVQSEKGEKLLSFLDDSFVINRANERMVLDNNPMYYKSRQQRVDYDKFMLDMKEHGLHYAVKKFPKENKNVTHRIKCIIKRMLFDEWK